MGEPDRDAVVETQRAIVRDVLRWALPALTVVVVIALVSGAASDTFATHPVRAINTVLLLIATAISAVLLRLQKPNASVAALVVGMCVVVLVALGLNGGLRSPSSMLLLFIVALCGWVYGARAATVAAGLAVLVSTLFFALELSGNLPAAPPLALFGQYVMVIAAVVLIWSTSTQPPARLRAALLAATQREAELEAEQARRLEAAQQFRGVFDQSPHLMALLHPDGRIFAANRALLEFAGLDSDAPLLGRNITHSPIWSAADAAHLHAGKPGLATGHAVRFDTQRVDRHGRTRHLEYSISPFRDEAGAVAYLIAEARDVTDAVLSKERRERTARLELVGQLAGGVAHDFNNVLMAIVSSAEMLRFDLEERGPLTPTVAEGLDTILHAGRRAGDLTTRLLTVGRRSGGAKRPMSLAQVVGATVKLLERTLPPTIRVSFTPGAAADVIDADAAALESALINLAVNARDAMPDGGELVFTTERVELDADWCRVSGFDLKPGPHARVSVRDTGAGIAPEHLPRVFEPFFTTKDEGKGTGLGLASVFSVMREHRGAVHVYSERSHGTVFHLSLPLSASTPASPDDAVPTRRWEGRRALVVDDEAAIRVVLPRLLLRLGISSVAVDSAEAGAELLGEPFDLLVTDIVLPGRRGNELAMEFLARKPAGRALLISGFPKGTELSRLPPERTRVLTKPFSFEALQTAVHELLADDAANVVDGETRRG